MATIDRVLWMLMCLEVQPLSVLVFSALLKVEDCARTVFDEWKEL